MLVIPALRRPRRENDKFETSLGYILRPCHKAKQNRTKKVL
jgi:hypothetical protein